MHYLDAYFPKTEMFSAVEAELNTVVEKPKRAFKAWEMLLTVKRAHDASFLFIGYILKHIRDQALFKHLDYDNFTQFLASEELGFSREKAYMCIKTYEYYIEYLQLDPDRVGKMNVSRLSMMVPMLKQIKDKTEVVKTIENMNTLRHADFVREVKIHTNKNGKPTVYFSEELGKWYIGYYADTCHLHDLGSFAEQHNDSVY